MARLHDVLEGAASGDRPLTPHDISLISAFVSDLDPTGDASSADGGAASLGDRDVLADLEETTSLAGDQLGGRLWIGGR